MGGSRANLCCWPVITAAARAKRALRSGAVRNPVRGLPLNQERPMPKGDTGKAVRVLDLLLEFFGEDGAH